MATQHLNSIELNRSFYGRRRPASFAHWYTKTPQDFVFSVKGSQCIILLWRRPEVDEPRGDFLGHGRLALREKLGPILWQFPPNRKFDAAPFEAFFLILPRTCTEAAAFSNRHRSAPKAETQLDVRPDSSLQHARNPAYHPWLATSSWRCSANIGSHWWWQTP